MAVELRKWDFNVLSNEAKTADKIEIGVKGLCRKIQQMMA